MLVPTTLGKKKGGIKEGDTLKVYQLLKLLSGSKIRQWDVGIQAHYDQSTPNYKNILNNRRVPFQTGSIGEKVDAVRDLLNRIEGDPLLVSIKTDIQTFYNQLQEAINSHTESMSTAKSISLPLEEARKSMCVAQYGNLGILMNHYKNSPEKIEHFFDLLTIRSPQQISFTGQLNPNEIFTILKHLFGEEDEITIMNTGNTRLRFYLSYAAGELPGTVYLDVDRGEKTVLVSALGDLSNPYLIVQNLSPTYNGSFTIDLT